jgi:hypothetical protein
MIRKDFIRNKAPEGREDAAHGASRGAGAETPNPKSPGRAIESRRPKFFHSNDSTHTRGPTGLAAAGSKGK